MRGGRVPGLEGVEETQVPFHGGALPAAGAQPGGAGLVHGGAQGGHHPHEHPVAGAFGEQSVELGVQGRVRSAGEQGPLLVADHHLEPVDAGRIDAPGRQGGDLRFEQAAELEDVAEHAALAVEHIEDGVTREGGGEFVGHIGAVALAALDHAPLGQGLQGLAHAGARHCKFAGQLPFRRQPVAREECAGADLLAHPFDHHGIGVSFCSSGRGHCSSCRKYWSNH